MKCSECSNTLKARRASEAHPYQYLMSGLPNVELTGITVHVCPRGHGEMPEIPRPQELHRAIAHALIEKPGALSGSEVRYLRKWAGMKAQDFAKHLNVDPATLSRIENGGQDFSAQTDKLIRATALALRDGRGAQGVLASDQDIHQPLVWKRVVLERTRNGWRKAA